MTKSELFKYFYPSTGFIHDRIIEAIDNDDIQNIDEIYRQYLRQVIK